MTNEQNDRRTADGQTGVACPDCGRRFTDYATQKYEEHRCEPRDPSTPPGCTCSDRPITTGFVSDHSDACAWVVWALRSASAPSEDEPSDLDVLATWIAVRVKLADHCDHACARCIPDGAMVQDGFVCAVHLAHDIATGVRASASVQPDPTKVVDAARAFCKAFLRIDGTTRATEFNQHWALLDSEVTQYDHPWQGDKPPVRETSNVPTTNDERTAEWWLNVSTDEYAIGHVKMAEAVPALAKLLAAQRTGSAQATWDPVGGRPISPDVESSAAMVGRSTSAARSDAVAALVNAARALAGEWRGEGRAKDISACVRDIEHALVRIEATPCAGPTLIETIEAEGPMLDELAKLDDTPEVHAWTMGDVCRRCVCACDCCLDRVRVGRKASATPIPRGAWHETFGPVLWWKLPVTEPPYAGTPLDDNFPEYVTHWTRIDVPKEKA